MPRFLCYGAPRIAMATFNERDFYLDEFHGHTLVLAVGRRSLARAQARQQLRAVVRELVSHDVRVLIVIGDATGGSPAAERRRLGIPAVRVRRRVRGGARGRARRGDTVEWRPGAVEESLAEIWQVLRARSLAVVLCTAPALAAASRVAERFRVHKLVVIDPAGGLLERGSRHSISFLDESALDVLLAAGEAEFQGMSRRRGLLAEVDRVLGRGVGSVNLCKIGGLEEELFTYEGSGTLFTHGAYCRVDRLGIDDFDEVERLIERGQREGLLKPRTPEETGELLLNGFGAWIGAAHLAGIGALRTAPYAGTKAGEVIGLYTITRFKGEGIGYRLVRRLVEEARGRQLDYLFAVTTAERAAQFFRREGFREVDEDAVPSAKWLEYDPGRRERAKIFRREVG
jgi:N-acetylglutamate synthase-like GNAT family acetyltransferase